MSIKTRLQKLEAAAPPACSDPLHSAWRVVYQGDDGLGDKTDPGPVNCPTCNAPRPCIVVEYVPDWRPHEP